MKQPKRYYRLSGFEDPSLNLNGLVDPIFHTGKIRDKKKMEEDFLRDIEDHGEFQEIYAKDKPSTYSWDEQDKFLSGDENASISSILPYLTMLKRRGVNQFGWDMVEPPTEEEIEKAYDDLVKIKGPLPYKSNLRRSPQPTVTRWLSGGGFGRETGFIVPHPAQLEEAHPEEIPNRVRHLQARNKDPNAKKIIIRALHDWWNKLIKNQRQKSPVSINQDEQYA